MNTMMAMNERPPFRTVFHMTETFGDPPRVPHGRPPRLGMPVGPLNHNVRAGQDAAGVRNRRPAGPLQAAGLGTGHSKLHPATVFKSKPITKKKENVQSLKQKTGHLQAKIDAFRCKICLGSDVTADMLFSPCHHLVCCQQCAIRFVQTSITYRRLPHLGLCPICRTPAHAINLVYF